MNHWMATYSVVNDNTLSFDELAMNWMKLKYKRMKFAAAEKMLKSKYWFVGEYKYNNIIIIFAGFHNLFIVIVVERQYYEE